MRTTKSPEERKIDLTSTARKLFSEKGYNNTSVKDITDATGVAKGTFYYYFESKEDVLDAVIDYIIDENLRELKGIVDNRKLDPLEKIRKIRGILTNRYEKDYRLLGNIHELKNSQAHYNWLIRSVEEKSYLVSRVIEEGIQKGIFRTAYPLEISEMLTLSAVFLFDPKIFKATEDEYIKRLEAMENILEKALDVESGSFRFITDKS